MQTEAERLAAYRSLRSGIRGSESHLIAGIDIAKDKHHAFFGTATGKTLCKQFTFPNSKDGFELLVSKTQTLRIQRQLNEVVLGLEPTANYHKPLADYLVEQGLHVVQVSGVSVKQNRELLDGRWDKHDRKDAANIADLIAQGKCQFYEYPSPIIRQLRELLHLQQRVKNDAHRVRTRIRNNLLAQFFPEMDPFMTTCRQDSLAVIGTCCAPEQIAALEFASFFATVATEYKGKRQEEHLFRIWQSAQTSIGCRAGDAPIREGKILIDHLLHLQRVIQELDKEIATLCAGIEAYPYLLSIPGVGPSISATILAALSNPFRFDTTRQVIKLAGFDLSAARSGRPGLQARPVLSKRGNPNLRYALCQAALVAGSRDTFFRCWFARKLQGRERERGIVGILRVKLAVKLLVIAWTLMKKKEMFAYERLNNC